jgi:hypothetical protein
MVRGMYLTKNCQEYSDTWKACCEFRKKGTFEVQIFGKIR